MRIADENLFLFRGEASELQLTRISCNGDERASDVAIGKTSRSFPRSKRSVRLSSHPAFQLGSDWTIIQFEADNSSPTGRPLQAINDIFEHGRRLIA